MESVLISRPVASPIAVPSRGDHLYVRHGAITHHGIYLGCDIVIHFASAERRQKSTAMIRRATLAEFADGAVVRVVAYGNRLSAEEAVTRAESMLGQSGYDLFSNNCEHFASWCVTGEHSSAQVEAAGSRAALVGSTTVAPRLGVGLVTGVGETPAKSAPNLMSGLKTVGGGSAAAGVGVLATAGAALGAGSMCLAFRDKPSHTAEERSARSAGRAGAVGGGALGVGGVIYLVGSLGVPGYGAAGLSSGLSALGTPLGGGMVAGLSMATLAPAVAAAFLALIFYVLARWLQSRSGHGAIPSPAS